MISSDAPFNVVIVGGGVAGVEAALALRELAGERVAITMLTPETEFVLRPMRVQEPFAGPAAPHLSLAEIADDIGIELHHDAFRWLEPTRRIVHTEGGVELSYDAALLALGARAHPRFRHALTLDDRHLDEQLHGLVQDVEGGYTRRLAFIAPSQMPWPLPMYELALMTARRAWDMNEEVSVTIISPEDAPLALFGGEASRAVSRLLAATDVGFIGSMHCETPSAGKVSLHPAGSSLRVDRVVALPELNGPSTPGVPKRGSRGFIPVDAYLRVPGLERVFAAGDATDFPVKHGGVAAQQADIAAAGIAALAGAPVRAKKFHPDIHGVLLGGDRPLYLSAHITGGHGSTSRVSESPISSAGGKVAARYLAPYLAAREHAAVG